MSEVINLPAERPKCEAHFCYMDKRDLSYASQEVKWCGVWYDCPHPGCNASVLFMSKELRETTDA